MSFFTVEALGSRAEDFLTSSFRNVAFIMLWTKRRTKGLITKSRLVKTYEPATCRG